MQATSVSDQAKKWKGIAPFFTAPGGGSMVTVTAKSQVDPDNPYAYLAIARHRVEGRDPSSALPFVDKSQALLAARGALTPGAEAHLAGLRGSALLAVGERERALALLEQARTLEPRVWSDGRLDAQELR